MSSRSRGYVSANNLHATTTAGDELIKVPSIYDIEIPD
jgi:hypothetical protein